MSYCSAPTSLHSCHSVLPGRVPCLAVCAKMALVRPPSKRAGASACPAGTLCLLGAAWATTTLTQRKHWCAEGLHLRRLHAAFARRWVASTLPQAARDQMWWAQADLCITCRHARAHDACHTPLLPLLRPPRAPSPSTSGTWPARFWAPTPSAPWQTPCAPNWPSWASHFRADSTLRRCALKPRRRWRMLRLWQPPLSRRGERGPSAALKGWCMFGCAAGAAVSAYSTCTASVTHCASSTTRSLHHQSALSAPCCRSTCSAPLARPPPNLQLVWQLGAEWLGAAHAAGALGRRRAAGCSHRQGVWVRLQKQHR